jgi:hypothetical protein
MRAPTLKAVLIDPQAREIRVVDVDNASDGSSLQAMYKLIGCTTVEVVRLGNVQGQPVEGWVDEEGLLVDWDLQHFFCFGSDPVPTVAGRMLVLSHDADNGACVELEPDAFGFVLSQLRRTVRWLEPRQVKVPAPHLDGEPIVPGVAWWTYEEQPR